MSAATVFRTHIRPRQVTCAVRHKMARELTYEQVMWTLFVLGTCVMFALTTAFVFFERSMPSQMQRDALRPVVLAAVFAVVFLHIHYSRQRSFVTKAPATTALVVREKEPLHFDEATSLAVPQLLLRYLARPGEEPIELDELHHASDAHTLWAKLDGFSARFERTVRAGDYVSILFDPTDPQHVRVVELERAVDLEAEDLGP